MLGLGLVAAFEPFDNFAWHSQADPAGSLRFLAGAVEHPYRLLGLAPVHVASVAFWPFHTSVVAVEGSELACLQIEGVACH